MQDAKWYGAEPIWVTAEKNDIITGTYFWVGSEAPINGTKPSIVKNYNGNIPFINAISIFREVRFYSIK